MRLALLALVPLISTPGAALVCSRSLAAPGYAAEPTRPRPDRPDPPKLPPLASKAEVKAIYAELALPRRFNDDAPPPPTLPFAADALKPYAADVSIDDIFKNLEKYKFRVGVVRALDQVRKLTGDPKAPAPILRVDDPVTNKTKQLLTKHQDYTAVLAIELELVLDELAAIEKLRADEPGRWKANYDYVLAEVRLRAAAVHEYSKLLGDVRTETLPALPPGATGWRLVPSEKMRSRGEVAKLMDQAREDFQTVAAEHKGTPWAALADRALAAPPGLAWEPVGK